MVRHFPFAVSLEPIQPHTVNHFTKVSPLPGVQAGPLCLTVIFVLLAAAFHNPAGGTSGF